ncbi:MAG: hypothetical protein ACFFB8_18875, partial [Promethearchaeota archaeon]
VEELHESWYNRLKASINLNNKNMIFYDLASIIKDLEKSSLGRKFAFVRLFLALMFLSTGNRLNLSQDEDFQNISINLK